MYHLIEAFELNSPLLIDWNVAQVQVEYFKQQMSVLKDSAKPDANANVAEFLKAMLGEPPQPYRVGSVGVIPIYGAIGQGLTPIAKLMNSVDVNDISATLDKMSASPDIKQVVLDVNSNGGTVNGVPELAEKISSFSKPTVTFARKALSAGYYLASATDRVLMPPSGEVGSIGVYYATMDKSKMMEQQGLRPKVIKAGKYKAMGLGGMPFTAEEEALLQERVDTMHEAFKQRVLTKRTGAKLDAMEGQTFDAKGAAKAGLITGVATSLDSLLETLTK